MFILSPYVLVVSLGVRCASILYGGDHMNRRVFIPDSGEPSPLLLCLCQYKLLQKQFHYKGANGMIALAIRAGAMVKSSIR